MSKNDIYVQFVCLGRGKNVIHLKLLKALYGYVKSELLWYELFTTILQDFGFELNQYYECVAKTLYTKKIHYSMAC